MTETFAMRRLEKGRDLLRQGRAVKAIGPIYDATRNIQSHEHAVRVLEVLADLRVALNGTGRLDYVDRLIEDAAQRRTEYERTIHIEELERRLRRLVEMLLADVGSEPRVDLGPLLPFIAELDPNGELDVGGRISGYTRNWKNALFDAYKRGGAAFENVDTAALHDYKNRMARDLKSLAVELLGRGGKVTGIVEDAVPLVAYALLQGHLPVGTAVDPDTTIERSNNALLLYADWLSSAPPDSRLVFLQLFQLSFGLGVADRYATALGLASLSLA